MISKYKQNNFVDILEYKLLVNTATAPTRGTPNSAGIDLYSATSILIPAKTHKLISTGVQLKFPANCYGRIAPRSGLAVKHALHVGAGVIDPDYCGEIKILLFNFDNTDYFVHKKQKIAQVICERFCAPIIAKANNDFPVTERADNGFGSTGSF